MCVPALVEHGKVPFPSIKDADGRQPIGCLEMTPKLVAYYLSYPYTIHVELIILLDLYQICQEENPPLLGGTSSLSRQLATDYCITAFSHDGLSKFRAYARQGTMIRRKTVATSPLSAII